MNKDLIIRLLSDYVDINNGCLSIITNHKAYNNCYIRDLDLVLKLIYINENKDNNSILIKFDDILGLQFTDKADLVGIKYNSKTFIIKSLISYKNS